jgi:hypothetical protein
MIEFNDKYEYVTNEIARRGFSLYRVNNEWCADNEAAVVVIIETYDPVPDARKDALARINSQSQEYIQDILDEYPEFERLTWPSQKADAEAWAKDKTAETKTLDIIAVSREEDREELIQKTLEKVDQYNNFAAMLAGKRQKLEKEIMASTDMDFICTVNFEV